MSVVTLLICRLRLIHVSSRRFPGAQIAGKRLETFAQPLERSHGTTKSSDLDILDSPRIYGLAMASVEATMACITTLLQRVMCFVMGIILNLMKYLKTWNKTYKKKLEAPKVPPFILSLIQRKKSLP